METDEMEKTSSNDEARFESVFRVTGEMGRFQLRNYLILVFPALILGMQAYGNNVLITKPEANATSANCFCGTKNINGSKDGGTVPASTDRPNIYRRNNTFESKEMCQFSAEEESASVIVAFRLFCEDEFLLRFPNIAIYFGMLVGSFFYGNMSDFVGRRVTIWASLIILVLSSALIAAPLAPVATNFYVFLLLRFITGTSCTGVFVTSFVLAMELVGPSWRVFSGTFIRIFFATGQMLAGAMALVVTNWRHLALALSLPVILIFPFSLTIPESPRWLLNKGRTEEVKRMMIEAAKQNNRLKDDADDGHKTKSDDGDDVVEEEKWTEEEFSRLLDVIVENETREIGSEQKAFVHDLFRGPQSCPKNCLIFFNWMIVAGVYYGVTLNTAKMTISPMLGLIVSGLVEMASYLSLLPILNKWGRKLPYVASMMAAGLLCFASIFTKTDVAAFTLSMIGKFFISASFAIIYIFAAELLPTVLRNTGMGVSSLTARLGSMSAPVLVDFSSNAVVPLVVFGALAAIAGFFSLMLPETLGRPLPETLHEAENVKLKNPLKVCKKHKYDECAQNNVEI